VFPYVENPVASPHRLTIVTRQDFNYLIAGLEKVEKLDGGMAKFTVAPTQSFREFQFQGYAPKFDTVPRTTEAGATVNFLKSRAITKSKFDCFVPDEMYEAPTLGAFNFFAGKLGAAAGQFEFFVFPENHWTMPGMVEIPQVYCILDGTGGFHVLPGVQVARQYFGALMQPTSDRDKWLIDAAPEYLGLMYVQEALGGGPFYTEMVNRRNLATTQVERSRDLPVAAGDRVADSLLAAKGAWIMHMLRFVMFDPNTQSDAVYMKFLRDLSIRCNYKPYTNADIQALAEKAYGQPLDWFFRHWLFERNIPEYNVAYGITRKEGGWMVEGTVKTGGVGPEFQMPVVMRVEMVDGQSSYAHPMIKGPEDHFALGPFATQPKQLAFNEFFSVLSKDNVKRQ